MNRLTLRLSGMFAVCALLAAGFGFLALLIGSHRIRAFDDAVIGWVQGFESPGLTRFMIGVSSMGYGLPVTVISIVSMLFLYVVLRHRRELVVFVFAVAGSGLLNTILKAVFHRERPTIHRLVEEHGYSFPSGHSMGAFSLYGILAYLLWRHLPGVWSRAVLIIVSVSLILAIGISRIYLGVHYPSDVLGGYLASGSWLAAVIGVYQRRRN
ncbi:phosphatase PAP2 family protein [Cohnella sp. REN36]|uniref:phosphatase PAP2 family protein n=1 Tax=Cohnella sp. REN36 TaxID=2887347 RepID=UPI001D151E50|nr:phosphatase PAP2 family protein [Cohnella sp. REN36]MCC3373121.1 phosphatase PAP2 family protein [Cohnella sp. REN36]